MDPLHAEQLQNDPRVAQAKALLAEAVAEHGAALTGVRAPDPARAELTQKMLDDFKAVRGAPLFYPYVSAGLGRGSLVELIDGSVKYDFISGIGVHGWGHSHPDLINSGVDAAISDTVMQGNLQQIPEAQQVCSQLLQLANKQGADLDHCFLTSSGAMANENAFKIAFQSRFPANRVLAFKSAFAGRTLGMAHVTDKAAYRDGLPQTLNVDYIPFYDESDPEQSIKKSVGVLERHLQRFPNQHALMIMELVQGEGGYYAGNTEFFEAIIAVLKKHNILLLIDEIQSFGRCEYPFALQHFGLDKHVDLVTVGKMAQVCATLYKKDLQPRPGLISQTFTSSSSAIFAAKAILGEMLDGDVYGADGRIARMSAYFREQLAALAKREPALIAGPYGFGAMTAFTPFDGQRDRALQFSKDLFAAGVLGFIAGNQPTRMRFLMPAAIVSEAEIDAVVGIIEQCLKGATC